MRHQHRSLQPRRHRRLEIHDMTVAYQRKPVLWDIDLVVPEGKLVGIVGPNGAGKTTLIKAVLGLVPLASGKVEIYGRPYRAAAASDRLRAAARKRRLGFSRHGARRRADGHLRPARLVPPPGPRRTRDRQSLPGPSRHERLREPANPSAFRRPAAARVPGPRAGAGRAGVFHGRAVLRRRCRDRSGHHRAAAEASRERQDGVRRASRPANRAQLFRLRDPAQHAARRLRADRHARSRRPICTKRTAAG